MLTVVPRPVAAIASAKVNLFLGVGDLRDDGYHDLETVFQALTLTSTVTVSQAERMGVSVSGEGRGEVPLDSTNLAWRAAEAVAAAAGITASVHLELLKGIPVAGGMAGGSADAAAALVACNEFFGAGLGREQLHALAAGLGSDVPFSLSGGTAIGKGRGEQLLPVLARHPLHWVIALARGGLSTPAVFRELDRLRAEGEPPRLGSADELVRELAQGDPRRIAPLLGNDLQAAALSLMPALRRTLRAGVEAGALAGIVSGSGPTCVFLCEDAAAAVEVATELSGRGVCRAVRTASGPTHGARLVPEEH